ncbi:MAG: DUF202 domain-containing protein [Streptosporangiaceae bacterium]
MSRPDGRPSEEVPGDIEGADPALARERTELAWSRSAIAFFGLGAAVLKFRPVTAVPILLLGAMVWLVGHISPRSGRAGVLGERRVLVVTVAVTSLALIALVLTYAGSSRGLRP